MTAKLAEDERNRLLCMVEDVGLYAGFVTTQLLRRDVTPPVHTLELEQARETMRNLFYQNPPLTDRELAALGKRRWCPNCHLLLTSP